MGSLRGSCFDRVWTWQKDLYPGSNFAATPLVGYVDEGNLLSSSSSVTALGLASFWTSGTGYMGYESSDGSSLFRWRRHSLGNPNHTARSLALLGVALPLPTMLGSSIHGVCDIIAIPPRDNENYFKRRVSFSSFAPHCHLNLHKSCRESVCSL